MGVVVRSHGRWSEVVLDWPEKRNSLAPDDAIELATAIEGVDPDRDAAVVVTGNGAFSAGGDLRTFVRLTRGMGAAAVRDVVYSKIQRVIRALRECPVPTIAAVDAAAVGLGMDLALACDIRLMGSSGWLRQGWARAGLIPAGGGVFFTERLRPGLSWSELVEQNRLAGPEAERLGLATAVPGSATAAAAELAEKLAGLERAGLRAQTELYRAATWPSQDYLDACADAQAGLLCSAAFADRVDQLLQQSGS